MEISKHMVVAVSGLVLAGTAALTVGAAAPAMAQTVSAAPHRVVTDGSKWFGKSKDLAVHHQRIIVINRNNNFSKSGNFQVQRQRQDEEDRARREAAPVVVVPRDFPPGQSG